MKYIAGVDVGNSTTEVCIASRDDNGTLRFLSSACGKTTGTKGTVDNVPGIIHVLSDALSKINIDVSKLDVIRLNEAAPVIGDTAMETIRATIITDSAMIGHNPDTPSGIGHAVGVLIRLRDLPGLTDKNKDYIVMISEETGYIEAASKLNEYMPYISIVGLILKLNEAVLVGNRLKVNIPIVDEVKNIDKLPVGRLAAIEVAPPGETIRLLSNPYGIASLFGLNAEDTKKITLIARSLIGNRSGIVIKSPNAAVVRKCIPAGEVFFEGVKQTSADVDSGAQILMGRRKDAGELTDVFGQENTNIGNMLDSIKRSMSNLTGESPESIHITDFFAVDTFVPMKITGALAGETCPERAVAVAAMVKTDKLPMIKIAQELSGKTKVYTQVAGVEAVMAVLGALTTPGTGLPLGILDLGGGSVDAAIIDKTGTVRSTHFAGAGELVTLIIASELSVDRKLAEQIKRYPAAKVESLFHIRLESGSIMFFKEPLPPVLFGNTVLLTDGQFINTGIKFSPEKIADTRRTAKQKVFIQNSLRALEEIAVNGNLSEISNIVLLGGSALDFEIPDMITKELSNYGIVCGRGNVRNAEGPRNAVATGLVMA